MCFQIRLAVHFFRYLILHKHGGIYSDMDIECRHGFHKVIEQKSKFLNGATVALPETTPGYSNSLMISSPGHPFMTHLIGGLRKANMW